MTLTLRYMTPNDIAEVVHIDRCSFSTPWSARSYHYEIIESTHSHMVVLEHDSAAPPARGWRRLFPAFNAQPSSESQQRIIAYGGLWNIADEAHISTIATHPDWRGQGYGEIVLAGMIRKSIALRAGYVVLEVRVSNKTAQNLYKKYDFLTVAVKQRYYRDNGEDAYDMRLLLDAEERDVMESMYQDVRRERRFMDFYTDTARPKAT
jgi:[ribosomal protein S18]-alanine N-acetyltransferase